MERSQGDGARVLVVDDDGASLEATSEMLHLSGFDVHGAPNGALGLEEVLTFRPEVVVFDFWMPVADGRELFQGIREVFRERLGLVVMSGTPEVEDWCTRVGINQFVRKPFEKSALIAAVTKALEEARSTSVRVRSSGASSQRRMAATRAVLLVGDQEMVRAVRTLLREIDSPIQVAVVQAIEDAHRALGSFTLDALAVVGESAEGRASLANLVAEATVRGLPIVVDGRNDFEVPPSARISIVREATADALVDAIQTAASSR